MKYTDGEIELDLDRDILNIDTKIPFRVWYDYIPSFIISWFREKWNWPKPSPRETYQVKVILLKAFAAMYKSRADNMRTLINVLAESGYDEDGSQVKPSELN